MFRMRQLWLEQWSPEGSDQVSQTLNFLLAPRDWASSGWGCVLLRGHYFYVLGFLLTTLMIWHLLLKL